MKKLLFTFCFCLFATLCLDAQTNTFPTSGNVGIGTLNPTTKLAILGDDQSLSVAFGARSYSTTQPIGAKFGSWGENSAAGIKFHRWLGSGSSFQVAYIGQSHYNSDYGLDFRTNSLSSYGDATTSRMYIKASNGNVGIGTTSPKGLLHVGDNTESGVIINNRITSVLSQTPAQLAWGESTMGTAGDLIISPRTNISSASIRFFTNNGTSIDERFRINPFGNVGIGTTTPDAKLTVKGNIHTNEVKVDLLGAVAPDYVFYKDYDLKSLKAVEDYIATNGHLPNIPSAKDMETEGIMLKEMNLKLLEKIEELTLYAIEQEKRMDTLETENKILKTQEERITELEEKIVLLLNKI